MYSVNSYSPDIIATDLLNEVVFATFLQYDFRSFQSIYPHKKAVILGPPGASVVALTTYYIIPLYSQFCSHLHIHDRILLLLS